MVTASQFCGGVGGQTLDRAGLVPSTLGPNDNQGILIDRDRVGVCLQIALDPQIFTTGIGKAGCARKGAVLGFVFQVDQAGGRCSVLNV